MLFRRILDELMAFTYTFSFMKLLFGTKKRVLVANILGPKSIPPEYGCYSCHRRPLYERAVHKGRSTLFGQAGEG